jgi:hypothetical protein
LAEPLSRLLEKTTENLLLGLLRQLLLAMLMGVPPLVRVMGLLLWTMMSPMVMARGARVGILRLMGILCLLPLVVLLLCHRR